MENKHIVYKILQILTILSVFITSGYYLYLIYSMFASIFDAEYMNGLIFIIVIPVVMVLLFLLGLDIVQLIFGIKSLNKNYVKYESSLAFSLVIELFRFLCLFAISGIIFSYELQKGYAAFVFGGWSMLAVVVTIAKILGLILLRNNNRKM